MTGAACCVQNWATLCHNHQENIIFPKIKLEHQFKYSYNWGEQPLGYGATVANIYFDTTTSNLMTIIFFCFTGCTAVKYGEKVLEKGWSGIRISLNQKCFDKII